MHGVKPGMSILCKKMRKLVLRIVETQLRIVARWHKWCCVLLNARPEYCCVLLLRLPRGEVNWLLISGSAWTLRLTLFFGVRKKFSTGC
jgi:hypothetical protein